MLAVSNTNSSNFFQNYEWECPDYSMGLTTEQQALANLDNFDLFVGSCGVDDYPLLQEHDIDVGLEESPPLRESGSGDDHVLAKKRLNHNESERDRRKKINGLYSSLRALLPASHHTKKLSIPSTIGQMVKYIPEVQSEVEGLSEKKQELLSKTGAIHDEREVEMKQRRKKPRITKLSSSVSIEKVEERELVIHISTSTHTANQSILSDVLLQLEKAYFLPIHVSSFHSIGGNTFYNLHLAMEGDNVVKYETLKEELLSLIRSHN